MCFFAFFKRRRQKRGVKELRGHIEFIQQFLGEELLIRLRARYNYLNFSYRRQSLCVRLPHSFENITVKDDDIADLEDWYQQVLTYVCMVLESKLKKDIDCSVEVQDRKPNFETIQFLVDGVPFQLDEPTYSEIKSIIDRNIIAIEEILKSLEACRVIVYRVGSINRTISKLQPRIAALDRAVDRGDEFYQEKVCKIIGRLSLSLFAELDKVKELSSAKSPWD